MCGDVELRGILEDITKLIKKEATKIDIENNLKKEVLDALFKSKLMGLMVPNNYGGLGKSYVELCKVVEEIGKVSGAIADVVVAHNLCLDAIRLFGREEQKREYLKKLGEGKVGALAITEPSGGSDIASAIKLKAERKGDFYVLNGRKTLITNGTFGDIFLVIARTNEGSKGLTAFIVEKCSGMEVKKLNASGLRGNGLASIKFRDVEVPEENILLGEGKGLRVTLQTLAPARVYFAAIGLGIAECCFEHAINYARRRKVFSQKILNHQWIQFMFAEIATEIECTKQMIYHAAKIAASGKDVSTLGAMSKLKAAKVAKLASDFAVEIYGGHGVLSGGIVERCYRDAKILDIAEGTSEIMRAIISRSFLTKT